MITVLDYSWERASEELGRPVSDLKHLLGKEEVKVLQQNKSRKNSAHKAIIERALITGLVDNYQKDLEPL